MSESEVQEILEEADDNGDGRLDYDEVCNYLANYWYCICESIRSAPDSKNTWPDC